MATQRRRTSMGKARKIVRGMMGDMHTHRYHRQSELSIALSATSTFPLLLADDDPDYDVGGDFVTACECPARSKIVNIDLTFLLDPAGIGAANSLEVMILRDEDQLGLVTAPSDLFNNDKTSNSLAARKNVMGYAQIFATTNNEVTRTRIRIRRKALKRAGRLADLDRLILLIRNNSGTAATFKAFGTITTKK